MAFLGGALSLASGIVKFASNPVGTVASLAINKAAGSLQPGDAKDKERAQRAQASLALALQGNLNAAQEIYGLQTTSATAYGKQQYVAAWSQVLQRMPELAAQVTGHQGEAPVNQAGYTPSTADRLRTELDTLKNDIKAQAAKAAGRVLSGTTAAVQDKIDPETNHFAIPTNKGQLLMIGGAVVVAIILLWVALRK